MVSYYLKSLLGLDEISVRAATHLLSNEVSWWSSTLCVGTERIDKGKQQHSSAACFCADGETNCYQTPDLDIALLKNQKGGWTRQHDVSLSGVR